MDADHLLERLADPEALEALYRESPEAFRRALDAALQRRSDDIVLRVWAARLAGGPETEPGEPRERTEARSLGAAIAIALGLGLLVRLPVVWLKDEWFYPRFGPWGVLFGLALYFWLERRDRRQLVMGLLLAGLSGVYVSLLPGYTDSVRMALIHLPILWWIFLGVVFTGPSWQETEPQMRFLQYNGELLILGTLVALGGMVFSALTIALFQLISDNAEDWYVRNVGVVGGAAVPVVATYLYDAVFGRHTGIASVLARVFAPLFLAMTCIYYGER